jgi:hypothetical protein
MAKCTKQGMSVGPLPLNSQLECDFEYNVISGIERVLANSTCYRLDRSSVTFISCRAQDRWAGNHSVCLKVLMLMFALST